MRHEHLEHVERLRETCTHELDATLPPGLVAAEPERIGAEG
jgi:hypothetical protein